MEKEQEEVETGKSMKKTHSYATGFHFTFHLTSPQLTSLPTICSTNNSDRLASFGLMMGGGGDDDGDDDDASPHTRLENLPNRPN